MKCKIEAKNISVSYNDKEVVQNVSFSFQTGKSIGIIGPNGAGKSTLLKAMLHLIPKKSGDVFIDGIPMQKYNKQIAYIPQRTTIDWDFPINVFDTVLLGTYPMLNWLKIPTKREKEHAKHCLKMVDLYDERHRQISELSGGQQQRVFLARALAQKANFFFLDEPFVGIDVASEKKIIDLLHNLRDEGKTIFIVHHDLSKVDQYFDGLILLNKKLISAGTVEQVMQREQLSTAYEINFDLWNGTGD